MIEWSNDIFYHFYCLFSWIINEICVQAQLNVAHDSHLHKTMLYVQYLSDPIKTLLRGQFGPLSLDLKYEYWVGYGNSKYTVSNV